MVEETLYTLAEAEAILRERLKQDMCMLGVAAPGHLVEEYVSRNSFGEIIVWNLGCKRCGAVFTATYPE